jgi:hypothetical protein
MANIYAPPSANLDGGRGGQGEITEAMVESLRKTKGWVLLIAIMLFVFSAFMILGSLGIFAGAGVMSAGLAGGTKAGMPAGMMFGLGFMYLIFAVIYILLGVYLAKYSSAIGRLQKDGQSQSMEVALESQQKFWRLAGVLAVIALIFMVLGIIAAIAIPMMARGG